MTFPDLASLAKTMVDAKVVELSAGGVTVKLHPSAFGQQTPVVHDEKAFADMPTDEELQFWSVEAEDES